MMLMAKIHLLEETATATCTGTGTSVYSKIVPPGEVWKVTAICVSEWTQWFSVGYIGIYNGTTTRMLKAATLPTDYEGSSNLIPLVDWVGEIYIKQGDRVVAIVMDETSDATLTLEVYGEILKEE